MTRATNFGRKRAYIDSTSREEIADLEHPQSAVKAAEGDPHEIDDDGAPRPKKKRKTLRSVESRPGATKDEPLSTQAPTITNEEHEEHEEHEEYEYLAREPRSIPQPARAAAVTPAENKKKSQKGTLYTAKRTETRRKKRIAQRQTEIVCFACRLKGHSAADCPTIRSSTEGNAKNSSKNNNNVVGICYRCGSSRHTLARCKKPMDPANDLPFASCFVCSGKGHLASQCPQNKAKGIYPNGGACKLCGDNTHLARNCKLRKDESNHQQVPLGIGEDAQRGADEDDFHILWGYQGFREAICPTDEESRLLLMRLCSICPCVEHLEDKGWWMRVKLIRKLGCMGQ